MTSLTAGIVLWGILALWSTSSAAEGLYDVIPRPPEGETKNPYAEQEYLDVMIVPCLRAMFPPGTIIIRKYMNVKTGYFELYFDRNHDQRIDAGMMTAPGAPWPSMYGFDLDYDGLVKNETPWDVIFKDITMNGTCTLETVYSRFQIA